MIRINPFYYGLIRWNGEDHQGVHEPLITRDLFNRAQKILSQRNCHHRNDQPLKDFVFRGMFRCGECNSMITAETHKGHTYYRCGRKQGLCFQPYLREESLTDQVRAEVEKIALPEEAAGIMLQDIKKEMTQSTLSYERSVQALNMISKNLDTELNSLLDMFLKKDISKEEYHRKRSDLVAQKLDLKAKLDELERNAEKWFEPWLEFVNWSKGLNKALISYEVRAQATALKKTSSNLQILGKKVLLTVEPPFAFVAAGHVSGNWGG